MKFIRHCVPFMLILLLAAPAGASERRTPVVAAVERCSPAVVNIRTEQIVRRGGSPLFGFGGGLFDEFFRQFAGPSSYTTESLGSGMIVQADGVVLTNAHVIERASRIFVAVQGTTKELEAELVGSDQRLDLAVLRLPRRDGGYPAVRFSRPDDLLLGETVIAIGNPLGLGSSITTGIISGPLRPLQLSEDFTSLFVQTDALINPGNSGGPLINLDGEVVGINTAIARQAQGIGFAIPAAVVERVLPELLSFGRVRPGFFGVVPGKTGRAFVSDKGSGGVLVTEVEPGSPAAAAGFRMADVILQLDGMPIESPREFLQLLTSYPPGSTVEVELLRGLQAKQLQVGLGKFPDGFALGYAERTFGFRVSERGRGLYVEQVHAQSPAAGIGLDRGDLLAEVEGVKVGTLREFEDLVERQFGRLPLKFLFVRDRQGYIVELP